MHMWHCKLRTNRVVDQAWEELHCRALDIKAGIANGIAGILLNNWHMLYMSSYIVTTVVVLALRQTHASLILWTQLYKSLQHIHAVHTQVDVYKIVPVNLMHPYGHLWPMITLLSNPLCPGMTAQLHHVHDFVGVKANSILIGPKLSKRAQAWRKLS